MNLRTNLVFFFLVLILAAVAGVRAEGPMLDDQIRTAFENANPDCVAEEPLRLVPIHLSGSPNIRGTWKCSKKRTVTLNVLLTSSAEEHNISIRAFSWRSILPPTRQIHIPGKSPAMFTLNGRVEIQFHKHNLIYRIQTEFPPNRSQNGPRYYHRGPRTEEDFALAAAVTIEEAADGQRVFEVCRNNFAWPVRDYGFEPEDQLFSAIAQGNVDKVVRLVESNVGLEGDFGRALVSTSGDKRHKPLHIAVLQGCIETVRVLVEAGAKVDAPADKGWTPLMLAAGKRDLETFDYLISKGADIRAKTASGSNVGHAAIASWLDRGRNLSVEDRLAAVESILMQAKAAGIDLDHKESWNGNSLLGLAAADCGGSDWCLKVATMLLDHGVDVNSRDNSGRTPLFKTITRSTVRQDYSVIRLLIARGADPNIRNKTGESLLEYLDRQTRIYKGDTSMQEAIAKLRKLLIDSGAKS